MKGVLKISIISRNIHIQIINTRARKLKKSHLRTLLCALNSYYIERIRSEECIYEKIGKKMSQFGMAFTINAETT